MDTPKYLSHIELMYLLAKRRGLDISNLYERMLAKHGEDSAIHEHKYKILDMIAQGVPPQLVELVFTEPFEDKIFVEWDAASKEYEKDGQSLRRLITEYIRNHEKVLANGYSLYFSGDNSKGKTASAAYILKGLQARDSNITFFYAHFNEIYEIRNQSYESSFYTKVINDILSVDVLVVDELGKENKVNDSVLVFLEDLIRKRTASMLPTIAIGNLKAYHTERPSIYTHYSKSCYAAMTECYRFIEFSVKNKDLRIKKWHL